MPSRRIMLIGLPFAGKTTQLWTMPKPLVVFSFDPKTAPALVGCPETEIIDCAPGVFDTHLRTLESGEKPKTNVAAECYEKFNKLLQAGVRAGRWQKAATIALDSYTLLEVLLGEAILHDRGRDMLLANKGAAKLGNNGDNRDDYEPVKRTANALAAQIAYLGPHVVMNFHVQEYIKEDNSGKVVSEKYTLNAYGALRRTFPSFFDTSLLLYADNDSSKMSFKAYTHATKIYPGLGIALPGASTVPNPFDMTIQDWKNPEAYGLGKLLKLSGGTT